jgi:hypothetical protein
LAKKTIHPHPVRHLNRQRRRNGLAPLLPTKGNEANKGRRTEEENDDEDDDDDD